MKRSTIDRCQVCKNKNKTQRKLHTFHKQHNVFSTKLQTICHKTNWQYEIFDAHVDIEPTQFILALATLPYNAFTCLRGKKFFFKGFF